MSSKPPFDNPEASLLAQEMVHLLTETSGLNEYMGGILPSVASVFSTRRISLIDYYENTDHFNLLFFEGYPADARYRLQRSFGEMEIQRALLEREPFLSAKAPQYLIIPCYFRDILEAAIVLENEGPVEITPQRREWALMVSRFLGLFMSSTRLEVNKGQQFDPHDLNRARQIQLNFLPKKPPQTYRCEVYGLNTSSKLVGGDYFDYFEPQQGSVRCILADACGHGMAAALTMSNFRGLIQSEILRHRDLPALFEHLNSMLHLDDELIQYLTGVLLSLEEVSGRLEYVNAGHYEPIVIAPDGTVRTLPGGGPPLGMFKTAKYPVGQVHLHSGDLVALFTDGLVDIQNPAKEYFGVEGILSYLKETRNSSLEGVANHLLTRAREFSGANEFEDDVTIFLLRVR